MSIEQEIYTKLTEQFGIGDICIKKLGKRKEMSWLSFIKNALILEASELYTFCGFGNDSARRYFKTNFKELMLVKSTLLWSPFLTSLINKKRCSKCYTIKSTEEFSYNKSTLDGLNYECKYCISIYNKEHRSESNARDAKRRAAKLRATPKWADLEAIKEIYKNCPEGYHVDHKIPLQGELVCGLHVHTNLNPISAAENLAKGNKYIIE